MCFAPDAESFNRTLKTSCGVLATLCFTVCLAVEPCWAQGESSARGNPSQSSPAGDQTSTIHVEVNQVLVPVIVADSKGHSVTGLHSSDFKVFEDGVEQKIVSFSTAAEGADRLFQPEPLADGGVDSGTVLLGHGGSASADRTYLVVIDVMNSNCGNFAQVRMALKKLFSEENGGKSFYALVTLGAQGSVVQPMTTDPAAVLRALGDKEFSRSVLASEQSNFAMQEQQLVRMLQRYCDKCPCGRGACEEQLRPIESFAASCSEERVESTRSFLRALRGLAGQLRKAPGRRTLVLISDGFNVQPGRDLFELIGIYIGDPGFVMHDQAPRLDSEMQDLLRVAEANNVVIYSIDSRGIYLTPLGGYDVTSSYSPTRNTGFVLPEVQRQKELSAAQRGDALKELAEATGGLFFENSNDLLKGMRQAFDDGRSYYLLAYVPSNPAADGKFHEIHVEVDRKNLHLRAKQGYWAPVK